jgi:hypothetical protein
MVQGPICNQVCCASPLWLPLEHLRGDTWLLPEREPSGLSGCGCGQWGRPLRDRFGCKGIGAPVESPKGYASQEARLACVWQLEIDCLKLIFKRSLGLAEDYSK